MPGVNRLWETSVNVKVHFITIALCSPTVLCIHFKSNLTANRGGAEESGLPHRGVRLVHGHSPHPGRDASVCGGGFHQRTYSQRRCGEATRTFKRTRWWGIGFFFFLLYLINRSTKSKHKASVYGLKSLVYGALIERLCRVCLTVTRTWVRL